MKSTIKNKGEKMASYILATNGGETKIKASSDEDALYATGQMLSLFNTKLTKLRFLSMRGKALYKTINGKRRKIFPK